MGKFARGVTVAGEDRDSIAILMTTGERERLLERVRADDLQHWPEDFLAVTLHPGRDVVEQCRRKEIALLMAMEGKAAAIDDKFRAFIHARDRKSKRLNTS